jgi:ATP-dependent Lon protease
VRWIDKVLEIALERQPQPIVEAAPVAVTAAANVEGAAGGTDIVKH